MANEKNINSRIQHKHDIEANWIKATGFIPKEGELIVYDADDNHVAARIKIGDGETNVNDLSFVIEDEIVNNITDGPTTGIHQIADNVADGFDFTGKNPNATIIEPTLTGTIPYGATGEFASAFGGKSSAQGKRSMAVGTTTIAKGNYSFAAGDNSVALGNDSAVFGYQSTAKGQASLAAGSGTQAIGNASTTLGKDTVAEGMYSLAGGYQTIAKDQASVALGKGTIAQNGATVVGRYNVEEPSALFAVGYGDSDDRRYTAFTVWADGTLYRGSGPNGENSNYLTTRDDVDYRIETAGINYWKLPSVPEGFEGGATRVPIQSITDGEISGYSTLQVGKSWAAPNTLVQRDENGNIIVADPATSEHAATKAYVDARTSSFTYSEEGELTNVNIGVKGYAYDEEYSDMQYTNSVTIDENAIKLETGDSLEDVHLAYIHINDPADTVDIYGGSQINLHTGGEYYNGEGNLELSSSYFYTHVCDYNEEHVGEIELTPEAFEVKVSTDKTLTFDGAAVKVGNEAVATENYVDTKNNELNSATDLKLKDKLDKISANNDSVLKWDNNNQTLTESIIKSQSNNSIVINEGTASGSYSLAAGTTDGDALKALSGSILTPSLTAPVASGAMSLAFGANTDASSAGTVAIGYDNHAGVKGYYYNTIDFNEDGSGKIVLAKTQSLDLVALSKDAFEQDLRDHLLLDTDTSIESLGWKAGDYLSIANGSKYPFCTTISNIAIENRTFTRKAILTTWSVTLPCIVITTGVLPFTEVSSSVIYPHDRSIFAVSRTVNNRQATINVRSGIVELGWGAVAMGSSNYATGNFSQSFGYNNISVGDFSFTTGRGNVAGYATLTAGFNNEAPGAQSIVGGIDNVASGQSVIVSGQKNTASGNRSYVGGVNSSASGPQSFAHGNNVQASDTSSAAFGEKTIASGKASFVTGIGTSATNAYMLAAGRYNTVPSTNTLFAIGNGTEETPSNAFDVDRAGNGNFYGKLTANYGDFKTSIITKEVSTENISSETATFNSITPKSDTLEVEGALKANSINIGNTTISDNITTQKINSEIIEVSNYISVGSPKNVSHAVNVNTLRTYQGLETTTAEPVDYLIKINTNKNGIENGTATAYFNANDASTPDIYTGNPHLVIPGTYKGYLVTTIGTNGFRGSSTESTSITTLEIQDGVQEIGASAFERCANLTKVYLPNTLKAIGMNAFSRCDSLTRIELPSSLKHICRYAFNTSALTGRIIIPKSCETIGYETPSNMTEDNTTLGMSFTSSKIEAIVFEGTPKRIHPQAFAAARIKTGTNEAGKAIYAHTPNTFDIYVPWSEGEVPNAPWGTTGTIYYNYESNSKIIELERRVDDIQAADVKETLIQLFDRDEFYEVQSTGTMTVRLTCASHQSAGSDNILECYHDIEVFFDGDKNKTMLPLPKGTLISITGESEMGNSHYLNNNDVTIYLEDYNYSGDDEPDRLIWFNAFTLNGSETINKTYRSVTSDHVLYADLSETWMVMNSTCYENTEEMQEVTFDYTLKKNKYLEAVENL